MNAYSSSIQKVDRVFLLYPYVEKRDIVGNYSFIDLNGRKRALTIRTVDLMLVLDWKKFVKAFESIFARERVCL